VTFAGDVELRLFAESGVLAPGSRRIVQGSQFAAIAQPLPAKPCRL
jgi:hypothetical protein